MKPLQPSHPRPDPHGLQASGVLARAFERAAAELHLSRGVQAQLLGVSEASLSRLAHGRRVIDPESKEGELARLFLRAWRSLDALTGGDPSRARAWLHAENAHLGAPPISLLQHVTGLVHVLEYLDAMRGKL